MNTAQKIIFAISIFLLIAFQANAQTNTPEKQSGDNIAGTNTGFVRGAFVDKDNDGICDNFEFRGKVGKGRNFVDSDGDGICDNRGKQGGKAWGKGNTCRQGNGYGHRGFRGRGNGYCRRNAGN